MKNIFTLLILVLSFNNFAQTSGELVIFSNLGERFFVMVNGERQNQLAEGNVKLEQMLPGYYSCKVISENNLYALDKNFEIKAGMRLTMRVVEVKGSYKLRYFSETLTSEGQQSTAGQAAVVYHPVGTTTHVATTPVTTTHTQTTTTQTTTPTTVNTGTTNGSENININVNMSETGFSTSISGTGLEEEADFSQTTTISTTTTTTSSETVVHEDHIGHDHSTTTTTHTQPSQNNFSSNCLVDNAGMVKVVDMIKNESFSDSKMGVAKQFTKNRCLTVVQIKEITQLFSFSEDKMEYVKYAYDYCMNTQDYYQLAEVFSFSDDKNTFNGFLNGK